VKPAAAAVATAQEVVASHRDDATGDLFGIAELCSDFGISPRAIRFYEDKGLLVPRRINGTRVYTRRDRARLALILRAKAIGSSLAEIKHYLDMYGSHGEGRAQQLQFVLARTDAAIAEVVQERKVRDRITTVTFDAQAVAVERMAAGEIDAMVVQNPFEMGVQSVRLLLAMHAGDEKTIKEMFPNAGQPDGDIHTTGLRLIVPDTEPLVKPADVHLEGYEYMPLSKFREWLATYGLSSS
jgi:DNA-binding transcriptional MerR regulator